VRIEASSKYDNAVLEGWSQKFCGDSISYKKGLRSEGSIKNVPAFVTSHVDGPETL